MLASFTCTITRTLNKVAHGCDHIRLGEATLARTMDRVCNDHEALIITRNGDQAVVMLSMADYQALEETAYLLRNPSSAKRLLATTAQLTAGKGTERKLK